MVNARSLAEAFDLDFRFVWPRGADVAINEPGQFFSATYTDQFEIQEADLRSRSPIAHYELVSLSEDDARRRLSLSGSGSFVEVSEIFGVSRLPSETAAAARTRFIRCFHDIGWSAEIRRLIATGAQLPGVSRLAALHVRAGDIVTGDWRHLMAHEKYTPTAYVEHALERLSDGGRRRVLVMSDNDRYLSSLQERFPTAVTAAEIWPDYTALTEVQRAFADILILSRCEVIVGPPNSAFSRLAANLGCEAVTRADRLVAPGAERDALRGAIARHLESDATDGFWGGLVARDICWCLDVFADELPLADQCGLARQAVTREPDFGAALARLARVASIAGDVRTSLDAAARAVQIAETVTRHPDPLVEALATDIAVKCLAASHGRLALGARAGTRCSRWSWRSVRGADERRECIRLTLLDVDRTMRRCTQLIPFQMDHDAITAQLRRLIAATEQLSAADGRGLACAARMLARPPAAFLDMRRRRRPGLEEHRTAGTLDPVSRDLDRMAVLLEGAVWRSAAAGRG